MKVKKIILSAALCLLALSAVSARAVTYVNDKATDVKLVLADDPVNPYMLSLDGEEAESKGNPYRPELGLKDVSGSVEIIDMEQEGDAWTCETDSDSGYFFLVSYDGGETWGTRVTPAKPPVRPVPPMRAPRACFVVFH